MPRGRSQLRQLKITARWQCILSDLGVIRTQKYLPCLSFCTVLVEVNYTVKFVWNRRCIVCVNVSVWVNTFCLGHMTARCMCGTSHSPWTHSQTSLVWRRGSPSRLTTTSSTASGTFLTF